MAYHVMQRCETGEEFLAQGGFATWEAAEKWIDENENFYPESTFSVGADFLYEHEFQPEELTDIPW